MEATMKDLVHGQVVYTVWRTSRTSGDIVSGIVVKAGQVPEIRWQGLILNKVETDHNFRFGWIFSSIEAAEARWLEWLVKTNSI